MLNQAQPMYDRRHNWMHLESQHDQSFQLEGPKMDLHQHLQPQQQ